MLTILRGLISDNRGERGQVLVISTFFLLLVIIVAAFLLDAGFFLRARRDSQNTADAAALAGAQHLPDDPIGAEDAALAWAAQNGWTAGADGVTVSVTTPYNGNPNKIEVVVGGPAHGVGFFDALMNISSRAVAEVVITTSGTGPGGGGDGGVGGNPMAPVPGATADCGGDNATVDGRVMPGEGYEKFADLVGGSTPFGEAFFACDSGYYYFAMRLNGPSTGGAVANENVYACDAGKSAVQVQGNNVKKLQGTITSVSFSSFTMSAKGEVWTVEVDGGTTIELDKKPATIGDLAPGQSADVKGTLLGTNYALASSVKAKTVIGGCGAFFSPTYHSDYDTGWAQSPKGKHTFKDLWKSDRARFQIACGTTPIHDFVQDYLYQDGTGGWASGPASDGEVDPDFVGSLGPAASASSLEYNLENPFATGWGDDPGEDPLVQSPPFSPTYPNYASEFDGWVWEMIYEFKVPRSAYDSCGSTIFFGLPPFSGQTGPVGGIHSSPAKTAEGGSIIVSSLEILLVE